jgi:16S rRNA (cytosine967-C5)-methyltransferase
MMNARAIAMHTLMQVARRGSFPDVLLDIYFKEHPTLDPRDRALVTELVYGVLRWQGRLDWIINQQIKIKPDKLDLAVRLILRLAVYQLLFLDRIPAAAAVHEAVELAKASQPNHIVRFVNGVLRTISRKSTILKKADPAGSAAHRVAMRYSYPVWLVQRWLTGWGSEETESFCQAGNQIPPTTVRVNTLKTTPTAIAGSFKALGFSVESGKFVPEALHLRSIRTDLSSLDQYERGEFQVQDEASQVIAHLLQPQPGERILDACAGLGAKSTHLAQLMENQGEIIALDNQGWKLTRLMDNAQRLEVSCIEPVEMNVLELVVTGEEFSFDRILLDAPCTGLGVIRRNPDIKWKVRPKDFRRLHLVQKEMLERLAPVLKPGGVLLYATCTVSKEENEETVQAFLAQHPDYQPESVRPYLPPGSGDLVNRSGAMQTWPHRHEVDGFFAARLRRIS